MRTVKWIPEWSLKGEQSAVTTAFVIYLYFFPTLFPGTAAVLSWPSDLRRSTDSCLLTTEKQKQWLELHWIKIIHNAACCVQELMDSSRTKETPAMAHDHCYRPQTFIPDRPLHSMDKQFILTAILCGNIKGNWQSFKRSPLVELRLGRQAGCKFCSTQTNPNPNPLPHVSPLDCEKCISLKGVMIVIFFVLIFVCQKSKDSSILL